ncbi:hypothetical protein [Demequina aurantiaca]|uniref:hypothetical protein n=1 Tax=Demequina aurantiaca TaxID=676200 RepID=UPI003D3359B0
MFMDALCDDPEVNIAQPGMWHESAPNIAVRRSVALDAWQQVATGILQDVASQYTATVTYGVLKDRLFAETGYQTRQLVSNWITPAPAAWEAATSHTDISTGSITRVIARTPQPWIDWSATALTRRTYRQTRCLISQRNTTCAAMGECAL